MKTAISITALSLIATSTQAVLANDEPELETITVIADEVFKDTTVISPTVTITEEDLEALNIVNVEDTIAHHPNLIVRKRFIGDPNGVIGIRGSNQFQTGRTLIFADGLPLHYHLQTRFAGAPRWSLVSPSEVEDVEVIYGPFSAEYSGNAIGGVVNINTKDPIERKIILEGNLFSQDFDFLGSSDNFSGGRGFVSYEDRIGDFTIFASYNRLQNDSQPLTFFFDDISAGTDGTTVTGGFEGVDDENVPSNFYGDSGSEEAITNLYKLKLGYDFGDIQLRSTLAYEERERNQEGATSYLRDANGETVFNGTVNQNGQQFSARGSNFQDRFQERNSLLFGLGASAFLSEDWIVDAFYSNFEIVDDEEVRTARSPDDPDFATESAAFRGRLTEFDDTGWQTFDIKFATENLFGNPKNRLSVGAHWDTYELNIISDDFNSITGQRDADELDGDRSTGRGDSGGEASTIALFAQYGYAINDNWDVAAGLRYEDWETDNGFAGGTNAADRSENAFSPKFSVAYFPSKSDTIRYSIARATRFPLVEELFRNETGTGSSSTFISDPTLEPEEGIFHNLSFQRLIDNGSVSLNFFFDTVDDVIFNQTTATPDGNVTTALPVDEVETKGVEFVYNQRQVLGSRFNVRFNVSYTDAEITENTLNPSIVGNQFPRTPDWRSHLVVGYDLNKNVDLNTNLRYASDSFGSLDNSDTANNVFGAHDDFLFWGAKVNWRVSENLKFGAGIENITNEEAFVFHPWPFRTFFLEARYEWTEN